MSCAYCFVGSPSEALREYKQATGKREMAFAVDTAMLHAHKRCKLVGMSVKGDVSASPVG